VENAGLSQQRVSIVKVKPEFVVAIDGPAGAGKSTAAQGVAAALEGFRYLDTGAMYRAVTAYLLRFDKKDASENEMAEAAEGLELRAGKHFVHGVDVSDALRTPGVDAEVSRVSALPRVRRVIQGKQREQRGRIVVEGRDIGSVVFPNAAVKVFLTAQLSERARRRHRQDPVQSPDEVQASIARRDAIDSSRADSPLIVPEGAHEIDTTELSIEEMVERIVSLVQAADA